MRGSAKRTAVLLAAAVLLAGCEGQGHPARPAAADQTEAPAAGGEKPQPAESEAGSLPYKQELVASGLQVPWEVDFAPDGRIFFTERGGALRVITGDKLAAEPVFRFGSELYGQGEAGLLGFALDPKIADNHYIYVYHSYMKKGQAYNGVVRLKESGGKAVIDRVLLEGLPAGQIHDGGRVKFGPDGMLYVTNGDSGTPSQAQDLRRLAGKILRIAPDGGIPADNPFPGSPVYSLGHRNPQGLAWHPVTGQLYSSEHGQTAHDEINRIEAGANYGWPLIQGDETAVKPEDAAKQGPGPLQKPLLHSGSETWAPSGITFVTQGPWKGQLLVANLRGEQVLRLTLADDGRSVKRVDKLLQGELGRIRTVAEGPDGSLYVLTNNRDGRGTPRAGDDKIVRLRPATSVRVRIQGTVRD